jgi:Putative peptidoglycan binding domain/L,D-transpeptidase catalytic domain
MPAVAAVGVLMIVVVAGGFGRGPGAGSALDIDTDDSSYRVTGLTVPASTLPGVAVESAAEPIVKTALSRDLAVGETGDDVKALQARLTSLGFAPGVADGIFGDQTQQAVWAFEKLVVRTPRASATGWVTNEIWQRMQEPIAIQPRRAGPGTHVEIYLPEQVAAVFTDNKAMLVIHISSGTGKEWCEDVLLDTDAKGNKLDPPVPDRLCGVSKTPGGVFRFEREVVGKRNGPLGGMDNPIYFNYGIAMHGAANVPLEPASHGCIRMHKRISETFQQYVHLKDLVYVWGEDNRNPEDYTAEEMKPVFNRRDPTATSTTSTTTTTTTTTTPTTTTIAPTTTPTAALPTSVVEATATPPEAAAAPATPTTTATAG